MIVYSGLENVSAILSWKEWIGNSWKNCKTDDYVTHWKVEDFLCSQLFLTHEKNFNGYAHSKAVSTPDRDIIWKVSLRGKPILKKLK